MTTSEFSDAFDTYVNSFNAQSSANLVFDEYEKSLFLTKAQEQIVVELYTGRNIKYSSFEETEELRSSLRALIKTETPDEIDEGSKGLSGKSKFFKLPKDVLFITYESAVIDDDSIKCKKGATIPVIPVTQDEFTRVINNPFKRPSERKALRLDNGLDIVEVVSEYNIKDYTIRYLSKPTPIILANLSDSIEGVTIDGEAKVTECKLDSIVHTYILERAVGLALASRGGTQSK